MKQELQCSAKPKCLSFLDVFPELLWDSLRLVWWTHLHHCKSCSFAVTVLTFEKHIQLEYFCCFARVKLCLFAGVWLSLTQDWCCDRWIQGTPPSRKWLKRHWKNIDTCVHLYRPNKSDLLWCFSSWMLEPSTMSTVSSQTAQFPDVKCNKCLWRRT